MIHTYYVSWLCFVMIFIGIVILVHYEEAGQDQLEAVLAKIHHDSLESRRILMREHAGIRAELRQMRIVCPGLVEEEK